MLSKGKFLRRASATASVLLLCALGAGCAGKPGALTKFEGSDGLPQELPKELLDKFEIREASAAELDAPPPPPVVEEIQGKKKRKKGDPVVTPAVKPAFTFPSRRPAKDPLWLGERQVFEITYFGMSAGDFTLDLLPYKSINNRKVYHAKGVAVSSKVFSLFYRLNDSVETFFDYDGLFSHRFHLVLDETKQTRDSLELYDSEKGETYYWNRWNHRDKGYSENKQFFPMAQFSQDSLSALFYMRTLPLEVGQTYTFPVISEGKGWEAVVTVLRKEMMSTPMGRVQTIVVKPETKYQGVLQKKGDSFIWFTDDDRRWVVRLEAKVRIGTVVASLKKYEPGTAP